MRFRFPTLPVLFVAYMLLFVAACARTAPPSEQPPVPNASAAAPTSAAPEVTLAPTRSAPSATPQPAGRSSPTPANRWVELFQRTPFPYTTALPAPASTPLDGTYIKIEPKEGTPVPCARCPDYKIEGGLWKLNFDDGIFRVYHSATGWRSLGSFTVDNDRLLLFNDPTCLDVVGTYTWQLVEGALQLQVIDDPCAIRLRAQNLSNMPWAACQPPSSEAAVTDHWPKPSGCD